MKRRRLGQHYLVDPEVVQWVVTLADIKPSDKVVEIGTGLGALTRELAHLGAALRGYEIDRENFQATSEAVKGTKAQIRLADAFKERPSFDILVASLPYSRSSSFVEWLCGMDFRRAVVVLQEDFIKKIRVPPGDRNYRGISALAQLSFEIRVNGRVNRTSFSPPPRVNSVVVSFAPKIRISRAEVANIIRLFSLRRREVDSALDELGMRKSKSYGRRRVYSLTPSEVHSLCQ